MDTMGVDLVDFRSLATFLRTGSGVRLGSEVDDRRSERGLGEDALGVTLVMSIAVAGWNIT